MADLKRRTLVLASGKQIKLFGNSVAIGKNLELGEGYAPNILSLIEDQTDGKNPPALSNPYKLTVDELNDLADFNMQLWMNLKAALRHYNQVDPRIFGQETGKNTTPSPEKPEGVPKRKTKGNEDPKVPE
jgi:hypothetical protein